MGNLVKAPIDVLVNAVSADEFGLFFSPKTGRMNFHIKKAGIIIPGRILTATQLANICPSDYDALDPSFTNTAAALPLAVKSVSKKSTTAGTARHVHITPKAAAYATGKEVTLVITSVPTLKGRPEFKDSVPMARYYVLKTDELSANTAAGLIDDLIVAINADPYKIVTAEDNTSTLGLTAASTSLSFSVDMFVTDLTSEAITTGGTFSEITAHVYPMLTRAEIKQIFGAREGVQYGADYNAAIDADYTRFKILFSNGEHYDNVSANGIITTETEVNLYMPTAEITKAYLPVDIYNPLNASAKQTWNALTLGMFTDSVTLGSGGFTIQQYMELAFAEGTSLT